MEIQKINRLRRYLDIWKDLPEQGSEEWLRLRTFSIGGSEMAQLNTTGAGLRTLILNKIGLDKISLNKIMAVFWGHIFEDLVRQHAEEKFRCKIFELGSVKGKYGSSYSVDGLGVVRRLLKIPNVGAAVVPQIALFEFKCPYSRILKGTIPPNYMTQMQTGLTVIGPTEYAIYGEALIRACQLSELRANTAINRVLHHSEKNALPTVPEWCGLMFFSLNYHTQEVEKYMTDLLNYREALFEADQYETSLSINMTDVGCDDSLEYILKMPRDMYSCELVILSKTMDEEELRDATYCAIRERMSRTTDFSEGDYFAFLPWKLFRIDYTEVERNHSFVEDQKNKLEEIMTHINTAKKIKTQLGEGAARAYVSSIQFQHLRN